MGYPRGFDCEVCPQGWDFGHIRYPQGGEFDKTTILDNEEGLEINLLPRTFPSPSSELVVSNEYRVCSLHRAVDSLFPEKCSEFAYNGT